MFFYWRVSQQLICRVQVLAKVHFIVEFMQPAVALSTNRNRSMQFNFAEIFFEMLAAMQFTRNEVMSS